MRLPSSFELFQRHPKNPILTVEDLPYPAHAVFNAGAVRVDGETLLLLRVEGRTGLSHLTVARSRDGIGGWRVDPEPSLLPDPGLHPEELWGIEDPRITPLDGESSFAVTYTSYSEGGPLVSLATTSDFRTFRRLGPVLPPENKDAAVFPGRFGDRWAMLHRPVPRTPSLGAHIWISFSPDLVHWGAHRLLLPARRGAWWDAGRVGVSPPPLRTDRGWLVLYHGVRTTVSGAIYRLGLALLDLEDPTRVLGRSDSWVFGPRDEYEVVGDVDKVVFPCGWVRSEDEVQLYYGGADSCVALATARVPDLLDWLDRHRSGD